MNSLEILLDHKIKPGETFEGTVMWELDISPEEMEINFFWYLEKYNAVSETTIIDSLKGENIQSQGYKNFRFEAPLQPYSFSGNLFRINWAIECLFGRESVRQDLILSNDGEIVVAGKPDYNSPLLDMAEKFLGRPGE